MYEIFAQLLKEKGITANTVGKATGITSATFSSWKKGIYTPKREKMQKIADYLGVSVAYLMGVSDIPNQELTQEEAQKQLEEARASAEYNRKLAEHYQKEAEELEKRLKNFNHILGIMSKIESLTPEQRNAIELILNQFNNK